MATEFNNEATATIGVWCGAGSRHETMENSGASFVTCNMIDRGSQSRSSEEVNKIIEDMGARGHHTHQREFTTHGINCFKGDVGRTIELLGDIVCNPAFNQEDFEIVKENTNTIHENNHRQYKRTLLENVHYNAYKNSMMGQPIRGDRDNLRNLTLDQIKSFHATHYHGDNVMVIAVGNVDHQQVVDLAEQHFS